MSPPSDVPALKVLVFTCDFKFGIGLLEVDILTQNLLTLLTSITLTSLQEKK